MGEVAWSVLDVVSAAALPEQPLRAELVAALAGIYGPLKVSRFDGVKDGERTVTIYSVQTMEPRSVLYQAAYHGPGSARESLNECVDALAESVVRFFRGCGVVRPKDGGEGIYGPATWAKGERAELLGLIPGNWPATPGLVQSSSSSSSSSSSKSSPSSSSSSSSSSSKSSSS